MCVFFLGIPNTDNMIDVLVINVIYNTSVVDSVMDNT